MMPLPSGRTAPLQNLSIWLQAPIPGLFESAVQSAMPAVQEFCRGLLPPRLTPHVPPRPAAVQSAVVAQPTVGSALHSLQWQVPAAQFVPPTDAVSDLVPSVNCRPRFSVPALAVIGKQSKLTLFAMPPRVRLASTSHGSP